jgi:hypothetical protein
VKDPQAMIDWNIRKMTRKGQEPTVFSKLSIKIMTQKWNLYNLRFVGLVMMLVGMFLIFLTVAKIRDPNINRKPPNPNTKPYLVNP